MEQFSCIENDTFWRISYFSHGLYGYEILGKIPKFYFSEQKLVRKLFQFSLNFFATLMKNKKISQNQRNSVKMSLKNYIEINNDPICPKKLVSDV